MTRYNVEPFSEPLDLTCK